MKPELVSRLQTNFFTGLAVLLPAVISIAVVVWLFGTVSNITNPPSPLLGHRGAPRPGVFVDRNRTHQTHRAVPRATRVNRGANPITPGGRGGQFTTT